MLEQPQKSKSAEVMEFGAHFSATDKHAIAFYMEEKKKKSPNEKQIPKSQAWVLMETKV